MRFWHYALILQLETSCDVADIDMLYDVSRRRTPVIVRDAGPVCITKLV